MAEANIYISFHPKDQTLEDEFEAQLTAAIKDLSEVNLRTSSTAPGHDIDQAQREKIDQADILLLLLSSDYLNTERSLRELQLALQRREHAHVVPVILRAVTIPEELRRLQVVPRDEKSVRSAGDRRDEVLLRIVEDILPIIRQVLRTKKKQAEEQALAKARLEAEAKARAEAETKATAQIERARAEVERAKAEAEAARAEAKRALTEVQTKARVEIETAKTEAEKAKAATAKAEADARRAQDRLRHSSPATPLRIGWFIASLGAAALVGLVIRCGAIREDSGTSAVTDTTTTTGHVVTTLTASTSSIITNHTSSANTGCPEAMVQIDDALCINETEVTVAEFEECERAGACPSSAGPALQCNGHDSSRRNHPMNCVNQKDAANYCNWKYSNRRGRLPTRSEWMAAVNDGGNLFSPGRDNVCWRQKSTCPVKSYPSGRTRTGLFDAVGNVSELTMETYTENGTTFAYNCGRSWEEDGTHELVGTCGGAYAAVARIPAIGFRCVAFIK